MRLLYTHYMVIMFYSFLSQLFFISSFLQYRLYYSMYNLSDNEKDMPNTEALIQPMMPELEGRPVLIDMKRS